MNQNEIEALLQKIFGNREKKYCNCAECGEEIESRQIGGRIKGRPYCRQCLTPRQIPARHNPHILEDHGPWQDNAIRALEEL